MRPRTGADACAQPPSVSHHRMLGIRYGFVGYLAANYGVGYTLACYLLYVSLGSMYIFCNFAVSHTHLAIVEPDQHATW